MDKAEWIRSALDRYEKPLLRFAGRIIGNSEAARDVVQETFLRLCKANPAKIDGRLAPWLFTVTRNGALNIRKQEGSMRLLKEGEAELLQSPHPSPGVVQHVMKRTNLSSPHWPCCPKRSRRPSG